MKKSELLKEEIRKAQVELIEIERQEANESRYNSIKELSEFSILEKIEIFDALYSSAKANLDDAEKDGTECDNNDEHYAWESLMEILGRKKQLFWEYYNSL